MKVKYLLFASFVIFTELAAAKVSSRMSRPRRLTSVAVGSAVLSWSPSSSYDDFILVAPQTFTLTNTGTAIAAGLVFSAPLGVPFKSRAGQFIISATTCGASLAVGESCTVDIEYSTCSFMCTNVVPVISNGSVTATSGSVTATLSNLMYNSNIY